MDNQQAPQTHKGNSLAPHFPTFTKLFSNLVEFVLPKLPYFVLWISANGMTWLPGYYKTIIWDHYGNGENEFPSLFTVPSLLIAIIITVYIIGMYKREKSTSDQRRVINAGFSKTAIRGGALTILATLFSIYGYSPNAQINTNANWIPLEIFAVFFVIGLVNTRIAKRT